MTLCRTIAASLIVLAAASATGHAASSAWIEAAGGRVRLVTDSRPDAGGSLSGMLDIELKPGWKTYWRDPGDAGVPPSVDVSKSPGLTGATLEFPAPRRHDEGDFTWAGYSSSVALPIRFQTRDAAVAAPVISADVFLGVCEDICVPVQATLVVDPSRDADEEADRAAVAAAFAALPARAGPGFRVAKTSLKGDVARFEIELPVGMKAVDLFIAGDEGYAFRTPRQVETDGKTLFEVGATRPEAKPAGGALHYTLVGDTGAVSGAIPYF